jgi:Cupin domain
MSVRTLHTVSALAGAAVLGLGLLGPAVAQDEASPSPGTDAALESPAASSLERQTTREQRKAERQAALDSAQARRAAERELVRLRRNARIEASRAERDARTAERRAARDARMAAWAEVRDACAAELESVRRDEAPDRATRREALREAMAACSELYRDARSSAGTETLPIDELYTEAASDGTGVVRTDLGLASPGSAPGEDLGLWHYLIPAGVELPPHTHPGWQLARVTAGELEYTVLEGEGIVLRADGSQEPMGPGTYTLATGDGVIENPDLVHMGANRTDQPVTLISATLFDSGAPISTLVDEASAEPSPAAESSPAAD